MKKLKASILAILFTALPVFGLLTEQALAADPGCYAVYGDANSVTYAQADCSSAEHAGVGGGNCYVATVASQGLGPFTQRDCDSFELGTRINEQTSFGTGGAADLEADCEPNEGDPLIAPDSDPATSGDCAIIGYLVILINVLSGLAGMAILASVIIAGYQYMTARDNAAQIQKAKSRIVWALTALIVFVFMYSLLNFLIPGGVI